MSCSPVVILARRERMSCLPVVILARGLTDPTMRQKLRATEQRPGYVRSQTLRVVNGVLQHLPLESFFGSCIHVLVEGLSMICLPIIYRVYSSLSRLDQESNNALGQNE